MIQISYPLFAASVFALTLTACTKAPPATAIPGVVTSSAVSTLPGRYYLRGVMETAGGLELFEDGSFRWYLIVGALDVIGSGRWELSGERMRLTYEDVKTNAEIPALTETILIRSGDNLKPDDGSRGIYVRARPPSSETDPSDQ